MGLINREGNKEYELISCICLTYNRLSWDQFYFIEEAVNCFLKQDYSNKELIIVNDTPGQQLYCYSQGVKIINLDKRCNNLSEKIQIGIDNARGNIMCRWDDDDIHLSHRLSFSYKHLNKVGNSLCWNPENYIRHSSTKGITTESFGGGHSMGLWTRKIMEAIGGYPKGYVVGEDSAFDKKVDKLGLLVTEKLTREQIFYIYRLGDSLCHVSLCSLNSEPHYNLQWEWIGKYPIIKGNFEIVPSFRKDYETFIKKLIEHNSG